MAPDGVPCRVCAGAGWWAKHTGDPIYSRPVPDDAQRCMYCHGSGRVDKVPRP